MSHFQPESRGNPIAGITARNEISYIHGPCRCHDGLNGFSDTPDSMIGIEDWDSLFGAVEERLRTTVEKLDSPPGSGARQEHLSCIKSAVLDCVYALEALHQSLGYERRIREAT